MNIPVMVGVVVCTVFYSLLYSRYVHAPTANRFWLPAIAVVQFINVLLIFLIAAPSINILFGIPMFGAVVIALGSAIGAWRTRKVALAGLAKYESRQSDIDK
jgi:hypothetical protein